MTSRIRVSLHSLHLAAAALLLVPSAAARPGDSPPSEDTFRAVAAQRLGIAAEAVRLEPVEGPVRFADLGLELFVASALDGRGEKAVVALTAEGLPVDLGLALAANGAASRAERGKLTRALHEEIERRPLGDRLLVAAWIDGVDLESNRAEHALVTEELARDGLLTRELAEHHQEELVRRNETRVTSATRAAAERFEADGLEVVSVDRHVPIVIVRADAAELARLDADSRVLSLDFAGTELVERLNVAHKEVQAHYAHSVHGATGAGAKVGIVEGGAPCKISYWLDIAENRTSAWASAHTTGVASCVASKHPTYKGVAPSATVYGANAATFTSSSSTMSGDMQGSADAISWAMGKGCQILNLSYGAGVPGPFVSAFDRYLDYVVRYYAKTVAIACGNSGGYAGDPGAGYNPIAVGAFDNPGTGWGGESMASYSSWLNPVTGVETPQVAAPGTARMVSCSDYGVGYVASGTSFAAPLVAGEAALLISERPELGGWPEPIRAIVMATAWHNIEGASRLSSKDGAGGIDAYAAVNVANKGRYYGYNYGTVTPSSFDSSGEVHAQWGYAYAGQKVRVCLSFDSTPSGGPTYASDVLKADLDLRVYTLSGSFVASSSSSLQPFEIVEFTAPTTGWYRVKIRRWSMSSSYEYWGTAFSTTSD